MAGKQDRGTAARTQDMIGIQDILPVQVPGYKQPWGVLVLAGGVGHRVLLAANSMVNLGLLTAAEQDAAEDAWMGVLRALDFPLQIFVQSRPVEMPELTLAPGEGLAAYAGAYSRHLAAWQRHSVQTRRVYLVVSSDGKELDEAVRELERRCRVMAGGLSRWVQLQVLGPEEVAGVVAAFWRKHRAPAAQSAASWDWDRLVVEGVKLADVRDAFAAEAGARE